MLTPSRRHNDHSGRSRSGHLTAGRADHIGESARGYHAIFVPSTALASPGYDGQPAVYLYIAALEMNVLNCRRQGLPDCHGAGASVRRCMPYGSVIRTPKLIAGPAAEGERWELRPG